MHTFAEFCIFMQNSASKSANLCGIPHYNTHEEVSMCRSSNYNYLRRYVRRVRIIYLREIENWFCTHLLYLAGRISPKNKLLTLRLLTNNPGTTSASQTFIKCSPKKLNLLQWGSDVSIIQMLVIQIPTVQWRSEIRPFKILETVKIQTFWRSGFKWSGLSYGYSYNPNYSKNQTIQNL